MSVLRALTPVFALAIMLPVPPARARVIEVGMCNGGTTRITLPSGSDGGQLPADDHECCRKGCHAGSDRRKKQNQLNDDGCC